MIRINLLPQAQRPVRRWQVPKVASRQALLVGVVAIGVLTVGLIGWRSLLVANLARMSAEWDQLKASHAEVESYRQHAVLLERQAQRFAQLRASGVRWAPRLNLLSDALVPNVWFTHLKVEPLAAGPLPKFSQKASKEKGKGKKTGATARAMARQRATLAGTALVPPPEEPSPVGALVQSLKRQPEFARWFQAVEIKSVERRSIGTIEVTDFVLVLDVEDPIAS